MNNDKTLLRRLKLRAIYPFQHSLRGRVVQPIPPNPSAVRSLLRTDQTFLRRVASRFADDQAVFRNGHVNNFQRRAVIFAQLFFGEATLSVRFDELEDRVGGVAVDAGVAVSAPGDEQRHYASREEIVIEQFFGAQVQRDTAVLALVHRYGQPLQALVRVLREFRNSRADRGVRLQRFYAAHGVERRRAHHLFTVFERVGEQTDHPQVVADRGVGVDQVEDHPALGSRLCLEQRVERGGDRGPRAQLRRL